MKNKIKDVLTFCGSPVFVGYIGNFLSVISGGTSSLWVQDIWPEAIISSKKLIILFLILLLTIYKKKCG